MASSITTLFSLHVLINIGVCLGVLPPTGIPLPFLSYGGSATVIFAIEFGIMIAIATTKEEKPKPKIKIPPQPLFYTV